MTLDRWRYLIASAICCVKSRSRFMGKEIRNAGCFKFLQSDLSGANSVTWRDEFEIEEQGVIGRDIS